MLWCTRYAKFEWNFKINLLIFKYVNQRWYLISKTSNLTAMSFFIFKIKINAYIYRHNFDKNISSKFFIMKVKNILLLEFFNGIRHISSQATTTICFWLCKLKSSQVLSKEFYLTDFQKCGITYGISIKLFLLYSIIIKSPKN